MKLYHFTAKHLYPHIKVKGITMGCVSDLVDGQVMIYTGLQWLTVNADFDQSWCQYGSLPYDRSAVRLTVTIPKEHSGVLFPWFIFSNFINEDHVAVLNSYGDPDNWYVYAGRIKPGWIREVAFKDHHAFI